MSPLEGPVKELDEKFLETIGKFVANVRNGKIDGPYNIAVATVTLLEQIINDSPHATAYELCNTLRAVGRELSGALPLQLVPANMVRRVLRAVRDETRAAANQSGEGAGESLQRLVLAAPSRRATFGPDHQDLREPLRDHIAELRLELESTVSSVCAQARSHVRAELVLASGADALLERFLRAAAAAAAADHNRYTLLLVETADVHKSHALASRLSCAGVRVSVIPAAAVYAVMSRVNKVVVSVCAALGGGAALAPAGLLAVTSAAKYHNVPVLCLSPLYLLAPLHACERAAHHEPAAPHHALPYEYESCCSVGGRVLSPRYDFVPPDHTTLFITNLGGSSPSYMYRLMSELYDPKDYHL